MKVMEGGADKTLQPFFRKTKIKPALSLRQLPDQHVS